MKEYKKMIKRLNNAVKYLLTGESPQAAEDVLQRLETLAAEKERKAVNEFERAYRTLKVYYNDRDARMSETSDDLARIVFEGMGYVRWENADREQWRNAVNMLLHYLNGGSIPKVGDVLPERVVRSSADLSITRNIVKEWFKILDENKVMSEEAKELLRSRVDPQGFYRKVRNS